MQRILHGTISTPLYAVAIRSISNSMTVGTMAIPLKYENLGGPSLRNAQPFDTDLALFVHGIFIYVGNGRKISLTALEWQL